MTIDEAEKIKTVVENKDYIVQLVNAVAKVMVEAFENLKIEDVNMFQLGYNKAIDDFVKALQEKIEKDLANPDLALECKKCGIWKNYDIAEIAEQLKEGVKNELQQSE